VIEEEGVTHYNAAPSVGREIVTNEWTGLDRKVG
jgi:hypothetical protein